MIRGDSISLRTIRERDLDRLYAMFADITNRGDFFPVFLSSEAKFRKEFSETGFWEGDSGRLLERAPENRDGQRAALSVSAYCHVPGRDCSRAQR